MFKMLLITKKMIETLNGVLSSVKRMTPRERDAMLARLLFIEESMKIKGVGKKGATGWYKGVAGYVENELAAAEKK